MGARLWYRSWPAVSQISNLTVVSSKQTVCVKKAAEKYKNKEELILWVASVNCQGHVVPPMVLSWYSWNCPLTKRRTRLDLPTADSPRRTSLNWQIFPCVAPLGLWAAPPAAAPAWVPRFAMTLYKLRLQNTSKNKSSTVSLDTTHTRGESLYCKFEQSTWETSF